ncbi:hypothetical protein KKD04_00875, partial [Patescibacteria group bacterium]|nr:hypothetical protein [Patescibacteria group bacterium]
FMRDGAITRIETRGPQTVKKGASSYYYKKLFPELPNVESRAKTISQYILRGYSQEEIKRLEYFLIQLLRGQIDADLFKAVLDRPYKEGGVGLWKQKAEKISKQIAEIMEEEKSLKGMFERLQDNPNAPLKAEVEDIRNWLAKDLVKNLSAIQQLQLDEAIEERIRNVITSEHFRKVLDLSKSKGGLGLKIGTSLRVKDKLESLLGESKKEEIKTNE